MGEARESQRGVVMSGTGGVWRVMMDDGATVDASLRGRLKQTRDDAVKLAVGDRVTLAPGDRDDGWSIVSIMPRQSQLARREPGGRYGERVVVANIDQVVIVFAAANPEPHPRMLDRFLVIAEANAVQACIVINKVDLVGEAAAHTRFAPYEAIGYPVHFTSAMQGVGLAVLHDALAGQTSAFSGPSGVGKSSLLNAMYPGLHLRVGAISESVNKGRHTTVGAVLHPLPDGGAVVDTPGLREIGMWGLTSGDLDLCYREFRPYVPLCRFSDCSHRNEPECAVREAVADGAVSEARYESYVKLYGELEEEERRQWSGKR
jgi:ribosome biogenesis GTPase